MIETMTRVNGFWWPQRDRQCKAVVFDTVTDMDMALAHVPERGLAFQAGGNCGVWAAHLAKTFDEVWTVEPDAENYACLVRNVPSNVVYARAAVGEREGSVGLEGSPINCGAYQVDVTGVGIRIMAIDDLNLPRLDYLCLDIEGMELPALMGAAETIRANRPVIQIEDKRLSERYGHRQGDAEAWLADRFGYRVVARPHRDVILTA